MRGVSTHEQVDPVFAEVAAALYGEAADVRELWDLATSGLAKSMPDGSAAHVPGAGDARQDARERRIAQTGMAATGVAAAGGLHAVHATHKLHEEGRERIRAGADYKPKPPRPGPILRRLKLTPKRALAVGTAGWLGLHGVELGADALAARSQLKTIKATKPPPRPPKTLAKGLLRPLAAAADNPAGLASATAKAAKRGRLVIAGTAAGATGAGGVEVGRRLAPRTAAPVPAPPPGPPAPPAPPAPAGPPTPPGKPPAPKQEVGKAQLTWRGEIAKLDADKRQVFGWCSLSTVDGQPYVDLQNDYVPIEEMESSAYRYVRESRKGGDMHTRVGKGVLADGSEPKHTSDLVESFVVTAEKLAAMDLPPDALPHGWWVGFQVNDPEQWQLVKSGERTGFSIHGTGARHPMEGLAKSLPLPKGRPLRPPWPVQPHQLPHLQGVARAAHGERAAGAAFGRKVVHAHRAGVSLESMANALGGKWPSLSPRGASRPELENHVRRAQGGIFRHGYDGHRLRRVDAVPTLAEHQQHLDRVVEAHRAGRDASHRSHVARGAAEKAGLGVDNNVWASRAHRGTSFLRERGTLHKRDEPVLDRGRLRRRARETRARAQSALHPPAVTLKPVVSTAITAAGYQRPTRRLAVEMRSRPGAPYTYKAKPAQAEAFERAPSKGSHYARQIRGRYPRKDNVTLLDRARLFALDPTTAST